MDFHIEKKETIHTEDVLIFMVVVLDSNCPSDIA